MPNDWRSQARDRVRDLSQGNRLTLTGGDNCLRILPDKKDIMADGKVGPKGMTHSPVREFRIHYGVGPDKMTVGCGRGIDGTGSCWLCDEMIPTIEKNPNPSKRALVDPRGRDNILGKDCFVVNASKFDPNTQKFGAARPWWPSVGSGNSLAVRVYSRISTSKKDYIDPVKGYNMTIEKTGEGLSTRYPSIEADESPTKVDPKILIAMKDLDEIVPTYSEEAQKNAWYGRAPEDEDEPGDADGEDASAPEDSGSEDEPAEDGEVVEETFTDDEAEPEPEPEPDPDAPEDEYEAEPEPEPEPPKPIRRHAPPAKTAPVPARKPAPASAKKAAPAPPARRK